MSGSIKLKHASGNGVSITAPSSNPAADRTLELPSDADGVIAKTDSSGNLSVTGDLTVGNTTPKISLDDGSGRIVELIGGSTTTGPELRTAYAGDLRFGTNSTERMRVRSAGGLCFNGDSAEANALDDYEEGTWTASNPNGGYTFSAINGYYTKIGNMVHWNLHSTISLVPNDNNVYEIHGLPYASKNVGNNFGWATQVTYTASSNNATVANMRALVQLNSTYLYFHTVGLGTAARVSNSIFRTGMQGQTILLGGTYMAA